MASDADPFAEGVRDPPARTYGNVPFWWWDGDRMEPERITDQLERLAARGVKAVCFEQKYPHGPPEGVDAPYFSERWWEAMTHTVTECDRLGMALWLHDLTYHHSPPSWKRYWQDRIEADADTDSRLRGAVLDRTAVDVPAGETATLAIPDSMTPVAVGAYPIVDGTLDLDGFKPVQPDDATVTWRATGSDHQLAAVGHRPAGLCRTTSAVVEELIERHYEPYVERFSEYLGDPIVGTFQDELFMLRGRLPCDRRLLAAYRGRWDEEPARALTALFADCGPDTRSLRARYFDVVVTALEDHWFRPLYEWHERRGLRFAHDNWGRNDLTEHVTEYGDYMRTMRWFQEPGYDDGRGDPTAVGGRNFFDAKLAASIATLYGRDRVWGELFHSTGWGYPPALQLACLVENGCYGLSRYNKHGLYYATLGGWYEHAPPDTHFRQPYWEHLDGFNDAVRRLMYLFARGDHVPGCAMLYPVTSIQGNRVLAGQTGADTTAAATPGGEGFAPIADRIDAVTRTATRALYDAGIDPILVDHESLVDGGVIDGQLAVGPVAVDLFVLPPVTTVRRVVLERSHTLVASGGTLVALGRLPTETVGGGPSDPVLADWHEQLFDGVTIDDAPPARQYGDGTVIAGQDVSAVTDVLCERHEPAVTTPEDIIWRHLTWGDDDLYVLLNTESTSRSVSIRVQNTGRVDRFDPTSGEITPVSTVETDGDRMIVSLSFPAHGFHVLRVAGDSAPDPRVTETSLATVVGLDGQTVRGRTPTRDTQTAIVETGGGSVSVSGVPDTDPVVIDLESWTLALEPALENTWGDARFPRGGDPIGAEVRNVRHRLAGPDEDGRAAGWHRPGFDDAAWTRSRCGHGPHWWRQTGTDGPTPDADPTEWTPYRFSLATGRPGTHPDDHGHNGVIGDGFLAASPETPTRFWTTVVADDGPVAVHYGPGIETLSLAGESIDPSNPDGGIVETRLPAGRHPVSVTVAPDVDSYVVVEPAPASAHERSMDHLPRLRWFHDTDCYGFDPRPWHEDRVTWHRFSLPVGTMAFSLPTAGQARVWVDGELAEPTDGWVHYATDSVRPQVAVRLEHDHAGYGGAGWSGPIRCRTTEVPVPLGDWCALGLASYSGIGVYRTTMTVPDLDAGDAVILELGEVRSTAAVSVDGQFIDTTISPPYEIELTDHLDGGDHTLAVRVANTLANHFATETDSRYVFDHQRRSGLFGPVRLRIERSVVLD